MIENLAVSLQVQWPGRSFCLFKTFITFGILGLIVSLESSVGCEYKP